MGAIKLEKGTVFNLVSLVDHTQMLLELGELAKLINYVPQRYDYDEPF